MSEFRRDLLSDRWVIIAENRAQRPDEFRPSAVRRIVAPCPFCSGHEHETPDATAVYPPRTPTSAERSWQVRVVSNKYPAVELNAGQPQAVDEVLDVHPGLGAHEVIIETPRHVVTLAELTDEQVEWTFAAYQDRLVHWRRDERLAYGTVFKNARAAGGASLEHTHSQLIATPFVPRELANEWSHAESYHQSSGKCPFCVMLQREIAAEKRIVRLTESFVAFCPYASRFPYETWVLPRAHALGFEDIEQGQRNELAHLVRDVIRRFESFLPEPAYNYWIHTAPWNQRSGDFFHWHVEIVPRLTRLAGFELGAGYFINPVSPEGAANRLRSD